MSDHGSDSSGSDSSGSESAGTDPAGSECACVNLEGWLKAILRCPACRSTLREAVGPGGGPELACDGCDLAYPVSDDIPVLLVDEARRR